MRGCRLWRTQRRPDALLREPTVGGCKGRSRLCLQRTWETISFTDFKDQELGSLEGNCKKAHRERMVPDCRSSWCPFQPLGTWSYCVCIKVKMIVTDLLYGLEIFIVN